LAGVVALALGAPPPTRPAPTTAIARSQEIGVLPSFATNATGEVAAPAGCTVEPTTNPAGWRYVPSTTEPVPAVVMVHKGFAYNHERAQEATQLLGADYAARLCPLGFAVFAVDYRFSPLGLGEMDDVTAAFDALAADPRIDRNRIAVMGGSHGGYMTLLALTREQRPFAAGVVLYGFGDVASVLSRHVIDNPATRRTVRLLGTPNPNTPGYRHISPSAHLTRVHAPVLLVTGDHDQFAPDMHALRDGLLAANAPMTYREIAGAPHGFEAGTGADTAELWDAVTTFLVDSLRARNGRSTSA
jgi:dipeptidyl aminopeptidase/acylaminoacyl peptidase